MKLEENNNRQLWEILVPCVVNGKGVRRKHHQQWDKVIRETSGGMTIFMPVKGKWVHPESGALVEERMIPVRFMAKRKELDRITQFTAGHYKQHTVLVYKISEEVYFKRYK